MSFSYFSRHNPFSSSFRSPHKLGLLSCYSYVSHSDSHIKMFVVPQRRGDVLQSSVFLHALFQDTFSLFNCFPKTQSLPFEMLQTLLFTHCTMHNISNIASGMPSWNYWCIYLSLNSTKHSLRTGTVYLEGPASINIYSLL